MTMQPSQPTIENRLRSLAQEIKALEEELLMLSLEPRTITTQRDIKRLEAELNECYEESQAAMAPSSEWNAFAGSIESKILKRQMPEIPGNASFQEAVQILVRGIASTPRSLHEEYQILVEENRANPKEEVVQGLREEIMCGLMVHTAFCPEELSLLQEEYLDTVSGRLVSQAIRDHAMPSMTSSPSL